MPAVGGPIEARVVIVCYGERPGDLQRVELAHRPPGRTADEHAALFEHRDERAVGRETHCCDWLPKVVAVNNRT